MELFVQAAREGEDEEGAVKESSARGRVTVEVVRECLRDVLFILLLFYYRWGNHQIKKVFQCQYGFTYVWARVTRRTTVIVFRVATKNEFVQKKKEKVHCFSARSERVSTPPPLPCPFVQPPTSFTGMAEVASCAAACCVNPLAGMWVLPSLCLQVAQVNAEIHHAQCCLVNVAKIFLIWSGTNGEANVRSFKT